MGGLLTSGPAASFSEALWTFPFHPSSWQLHSWLRDATRRPQEGGANPCLVLFSKMDQHFQKPPAGFNLRLMAKSCAPCQNKWLASQVERPLLTLAPESVWLRRMLKHPHVNIIGDCNCVGCLRVASSGFPQDSLSICENKLGCRGLDLTVTCSLQSLTSLAT